MVTVTTGPPAELTLLECPFESAVHKALAVPFFYNQYHYFSLNINERIV